MNLYVVDSNFFIEAHRVNYPIDIAESYWLKIKSLAENEVICSIDKVKEELYDKNDILENWCRESLPKDFFKDTSTVMNSYKKVVQWINTKRNHYLPRAIEEFLSSDEADAFLIAFALSDIDNRVIVTQETSEPNRINKIKIPDVCKALQIRYLNTVSLFREIGEKF